MSRTPVREDPSRVFRALSVERRIRMVQILTGRTLCVGALSNLLGISAGAVSQHLRILKDAGLVEADRRGYFVHYRVAPGARRRIRRIMDKIFAATKAAAKHRVKGGRTWAAKKPNAKNRKA